MKWTLVRYRAKPDQADENQRLSAAVFEELRAKEPGGLRYAVFRLPDDTFVHLALQEDGAAGLSTFPAFRAFSEGVRQRCIEPPLVAQPTLVGNYGMLEH
jgi:quinol monooxygenase YgiN